MGYRKDVTGVDELIAKIEAIKDEAPRRLAVATTAGAMRVHADAVRRAPYKTGNLRRSIHPDITEATKDRTVIEIGTDVEYAAYMEFGTARIAPRPYLRPALDENRPGVVRDIRLAMGALLREKAR